MDNKHTEATALPAVRPPATAADTAAVTDAGRLRRPTAADASAGLITALFSIPEGMAYAAIAGFDPVAGLYSGAVPAVLGSAFARTALMVTTLTSAISLTAHGVLLDARLDPVDPANVAALTLAVGIAMTVFAALRLGSLLRLISPGAMTGFSVGIAVQIIAGSLDDATGYHPGHHNKLLHIADWAAHAGSWATGPTVVAGATVAVWGLVHLVRRLRALSVLIALAVVSAAVAVCGPEVPLAGSLGPIPAGLPALTLPAWDALPHLATGACAVALVGLAQAAGIPATTPHPDTSRTAIAKDILAQAAANIGGAFFQALPAGGSLSRTGVALAAQGRTRWTGIFSGAVLALLVCTLAPLVARIPLAVIGALIIIIGAKLITGRLDAIHTAWRTGPLEAVAIILTFLTATQAPLHYAIVLGLLLSLAIRLIRTARDRFPGEHAPRTGLRMRLPRARNSFTTAEQPAPPCEAPTPAAGTRPPSDAVAGPRGEEQELHGEHH
ncbi:SulP family inorganic anion transporter [Streptomyces sp. ET3-23]|uniref:SulP family inorganic anion transporter n=1 Tax=Streptomyces sp. ET3-23 TaxID=2885643 RepID=UPI001D12EF53|nr:SulP family inorganic anion transporter [Streptomyces sp. ET3-23]MCC2275234.1 SulP family inorganic anion transporter [Streptomyces sp. ET3-23]